MPIEIRDASGWLRRDLDDDALIDAIRRMDPTLVGGFLDELVLSWPDRANTRLVYRPAPGRGYLVTHVDAHAQHWTAIGDGNAAERVTIDAGGEPEVWPGDQFIDPLTAGALAERFLLDGGQDPAVEWQPAVPPL